MSRKCINCGAVLAQDSTGELCSPCQKKKQEEITEKMGDNPNYDIDDISFILGLSHEQARRLGQKGIIPGRIPGIKKHLYLGL